MVDASALIASIERSLGEHMERLHEASAFIAPSLLAYEVGNIVHSKKPNAFAATPASRAAFVREILSDLELQPFDAEGYARAGVLAEESRISFYDACYLQLAIDRDAALLSEDEKLAKAAAKKLRQARVLRLP